MVRVRIDLPLFSSPTKAFAAVYGELEVESLPRAGDAFPWPEEWVMHGPSQLSDPNQSRVWGVSDWDLGGAQYLVTMYGIVCDSVSEARKCAAFFQAIEGLTIEE